MTLYEQLFFNSSNVSVLNVGCQLSVQNVHKVAQHDLSLLQNNTVALSMIPRDKSFHIANEAVFNCFNQQLFQIMSTLDPASQLKWNVPACITYDGSSK